MNTTKDLSTWTCEGQSDLTDLVDVEHINGSMPADENEREKARQAFYQGLCDGTFTDDLQQINEVTP